MTRWIQTLLLTALLGCVGTPVPQPPNVDPINPDLLLPLTEEATVRVIRGGPGAAVPGSEVWTWNLEDALGPTVAEVLEDGSFTAELSSFSQGTDELRLQARTGVDRAEPVDVLFSGANIELPNRPSCVAIPLDVDLGTARQGVITLDNECGSDVQLLAVDMKQGTEEFALTGPITAVLADGTSIRVDVRASGVGTVEDIVFFRIQVDSVTHRFPVGLIARPPP